MADLGGMWSLGMGRQLEIYRGGLAGKTPELPISAEDLDREAASVLNPSAYDYVAGGAGSEDTMRANLEAFRRHRLVPRYLRDVSRRDLGIELLGVRRPTPILLAPIGVLGLLHKDAELAAARAAAGLGVPFILSTVSVDADGAGGRGDGRGASVVPALLAPQRRAGRQPRRPGRALGLSGDRGHDRHLSAGLARARLEQRLPALPPRRRPGELLQRPGLPPGGGRRSAGRSAADRRVLRLGVLRPIADLGRPREAAAEHAAADPHQGGPPSRRRASGPSTMARRA